MLLFLLTDLHSLKKEENISAAFMNKISFILIDYAINKSVPGRLIQVIAKGG